MLNKAVRNYDVYRLLEEKLKAMLTSLPLVQVKPYFCLAEGVVCGWFRNCIIQLCESGTGSN